MNIFPWPKTRISLLLAGILTLSACAGMPLQRPPEAHLSFQSGQQVTVDVTAQDPALKAAFLKWARRGVYSQTPVYRQLPGIFVLTGKPRLAGNGYLPGQAPTMNLEDPKTKPAEAKNGDIGLVIHADGTVGPEIILVYGYGIVACCEAPANIRIGKITSGKSALGSVQRGDNLTGIAIH